MPDQPDIINKRVLSVRISRELYRKLQKDAVARKMQFNEFLRVLIINATDHVDLNNEDFEAIKIERDKDVERARAKRRLPKG